MSRSPSRDRSTSRAGRTLAGSSGGGDGGGGGGSAPTERAQSHGTLPAGSNVITFPSGTIAGDLLVIAYSSDFARNALPSGWTLVMDDYQTYQNGGILWKVATSGDISTGSVTLGVGGSSGGEYSILSFTTGTFDASNPVRVLGYRIRDSAASAPPETLPSGTSYGNSRVYHFVSRSTNTACTFTCDVGSMVWQSSTTAHSGALYSEALTAATARAAVWTVSPSSATTYGGFFVTFEVLSAYTVMSYSAAVTPSLLAWWKLDETSGTQAADSSGNARHATYDATAVLSQSTVRPNGPRAAKATAGPVAQISGASWMNVVPYTAVCWFRSVNTSDGGLFGRYGSGLNGGWLLWQRNGNWSAVARTAGSDNQLGLDTIVTSTNHMIAVTFDGTRMIGYLDGRPEGSLPTSSQAAPSGTDPIILGGYTFSNSLATMQDCSFHSAVLTPAQIYDIYKAG